LRRLEEIGIKNNWIYEVVVSTFHVRVPHAAPMGIWSEDLDTLNLAIYRDSKTLKNIIKKKEFAVNIVDDIKTFYESLFNKGNIAYAPSNQINAPLIRDASAIIECKVTHIAQKENRFHIKAEIADIRISYKIRLINRAKGLALESLILATRLHHFPDRRIEEILKENCRVIAKVAPGSMYQQVMENILKVLN
jgi:hypothetical protein